MKQAEAVDKKDEGYVFTSYGKVKYLRDVLIALDSIRRYDTERPAAIYCSKEHREELEKLGFDKWFTHIGGLPEENRSIVGFKHFVHLFMPFKRNMYLDSDMLFCRNPDPLWYALRPYPYTITGIESADVFFGASKSVGIVADLFFRRRQRTLRKFGLTHLFRVQTGIMYAADEPTTRRVGELAYDYLGRMDETHFVSRTKEKNRKLESCEWSLGMAMSKLKMHVFPWFSGYESPQLDYISYLTDHDEQFTKLICKYYCNPFIYSLRGIRNPRIHRFVLALFSPFPRSKDHMWVTPYIIHFGWNHEKHHFEKYASARWEKLKHEKGQVRKPSTA